MSETLNLNSRSRGIGVFDSGVGGLSVLKAIRAALPDEDLIYIADSLFAPYGDKSTDYITSRTLELAQWLEGAGVRALTLACNTATAVSVKALRACTSLPVVAIEPAIKPAVGLTQSGVIGVMATQQTVQSENVIGLCSLHGQDKRIILQACPGWVELVEQGELDGVKTQKLLQLYIDPLIEQGADTLVLGCTHFPFLQPCIEKIYGQSLNLLDPAQAVAAELVRRLKLIESNSNSSAEHDSIERPKLGQVQLFTTGDETLASHVMSLLWGESVKVERLSVWD
jgi:glutamate racemase